MAWGSSASSESSGPSKRIVAAVLAIAAVVCAVLAIRQRRAGHLWSWTPRRKPRHYRDVRVSNQRGDDSESENFESDEAEEALNGRPRNMKAARSRDNAESVVTLDASPDSEDAGYEAEAEEKVNMF